MELVILLVVFVALAIFIVLAYKGYNIIFLTVICSIVVAAFGMQNPITVLNETYLASFSGFIKSWFLIYVLSATFAKLMGECGAARSIALKLAKISRKMPGKEKFIAIISLPIINTILTYGGVSSLVCVFIMVGIAKDLFIEMDIPWHFYGVAALGSATYAIGSLPGAPDVLNLTPTKYLGTTPMAAPGYGILAAVIMFALSAFYLKIKLAKCEARGEKFLPTGAAIAADASIGGQKNVEYPLWRSLLPPITLLVVMNVLKQPVVLAMICAILVCMVLFWAQLKPILKPCIANGVPTGVTTAALISCTVAFGKVVATSPAYTLVVGGLNSLSWMPAAFQIFLCVNVVAALTSSSTSAISIVFEQFAERFLAPGLAPAAIHRVATTTALGLNTLPHSVGVCNAAGASRLTIGEIYQHYLWITVVFPLVAALFWCCWPPWELYSEQTGRDKRIASSDGANAEGERRRTAAVIMLPQPFS